MGDNAYDDGEVEGNFVLDNLGLMVQKRFREFLEEFSILDDYGIAFPEDVIEEAGGPDKFLPYYVQMRSLIPRGHCTLHVDFSHVLHKDHVLAEAILGDFYHYSPFLNKSVQQFAFANFRPELMAHNFGENVEFFASFHNLPQVQRIRTLRTDKIGHLVSITGTVTRTSEVRPELLYATFRCRECGTVIRDVEQQFKFTEPLLCTKREGPEKCDNRRKWDLMVEASKFIDWQKIRVQENANEVPAGSMPRTLEVILRQDMVERVKPGDKCIFTGVLVAIPDVSKLKTPGDGPSLVKVKSTDRKMEMGEGVTGIKSLGVREMTYKLSFLACSIQSLNDRFGATGPNSWQNAGGEVSVDFVVQQLQRMTQIQERQSADTMEEETVESIRDQYTEEDIEELSLMANQPNLLTKMRRSIAPSVFGHEDVKLGILLMLFGGVHKKTGEGIKLRGDINVCIVGDPSTAKSQFLKYVCSFLPRTIYTSGKASSAAGLTASVTKDPDTGEYTVEAGALMLADNGICCIDEFDKMDEKDQVAIHEAMEQQTISITKAGIQATLNARTSILAAANPIEGRYQQNKTLQQNIQLSPAIMSRFDLFFVVLDRCEESQDRVIAEHIIRVHQRRIQLLLQNRDPEEANDGAEFNNGHINTQSQQEQIEQQLFSTSQLQSYIKYARTIDPIIPPEVQPKLVEAYRKLREGDLVGQNRSSYRITVRQLEALIRLTEAIARLHLDERVRPRYVDWAYHLLHKSIVDVHSADLRFEDPGVDAQPGSAVRQFRGEDEEEDDDNDLVEGNNNQNGNDSASGSDDDDSDSDVDMENAGDRQNTENGGKRKKSSKNKRKKQEIVLPFEEYAKLKRQITLYLRNREDEARAANKNPGVRQRDIVRHILSSMSDDISSEQELFQKRHLINQVLHQLVEKDSVLLEVAVNPAEVEPESGDEDEDDDEDEQDENIKRLKHLEARYLMVHPNHDPTF